MKLNLRFILVTSLIVLTISISSTLLLYSLAGRVLTQQQSKTIINSTSDFIFAFQNELQKTDEDLRSILPSINKFSSINLEQTNIDFLFTLVNDSTINSREFKVKSSSYLNVRSVSFIKFFENNPNTVLRYMQLLDGRIIYYGRMISSDFLNKIAEKIKAEVSLVVNDSPIEVSHPETNQRYLLSILNSVRFLKLKNNYDIFTEELDNADYIAALFTPRSIITPGAKIDFIVFHAFREGVEFRKTLRIVVLLIILAGSAITFITVLVSTAKLRKQIFLLSQAAEITGRGDLEHRVPIITQDEIGHLGETFNKMLDELVLKKKVENEYSEFIALINQSPTLKQISDAALSKIIKSTGLTFGVLYIIENKSLRLISSFGISKEIVSPTQEEGFYSSAIEKKEKAEFHFHDNFPEIKTGLASIKIKYMMIFPVIYNKETIAVLELASESSPDEEIGKYIDAVHEQLAVGLVNAKTFEQLENLVNELQKLNEEYQKQNRQIIEQNDLLKELHKQLSEKADELEQQRLKAVELTKVKSEFLASMSHELRTPLISILGLTELLLKDIGVATKVKDRLNIIYRNGNKLLGLLNNILEFSKFEMGKIDIKKESFLLNDFIEEIYSNIFQLATEKQLQFIVNLPKNKNALVNTDKAKLEQILLNLLVNAVKFTEKGFVQISCDIKNSFDLEFIVSDSGIGISEKHQKIIFHEFRQVDGSSSRKYGGVGLGLAICKKYIELLGGNFLLQSELGKGSKFSFVLPEVVLDVIAQEESVLSAMNLNVDKNGIVKSALIINDNNASQKLIGDYLASYGYKIFSCATFSEGINIAKEINPSAIVIDPFIYNENVWAFIYNLRSVQPTKNIPIIFTIIIEEEKVGWEPQIFDFMIAPITIESFEEIISKIENYFPIQVKKVHVVGSFDESSGKLSEQLKNKKELELVIQPNYQLAEMLLSNADCILIDVDSAEEYVFDICYKLIQNRATKNIPVILILPKEISKDMQALLNKRLKEISLKVKSHPMDVLKALRDRLKIESPEINKKMNLVDEQNKEKILPPRSKKERAHGSKPTVMIVDDDSDALFTVGEFVKEMDCNPFFAHNGMECLLMLNYIEPDLILLDIMMPQMDGFETIRRIRGNSKFSDITVWALTAYAMLEDKEVIEKNGFDDLITKPINSQVLTAKLKKYLNETV